MWKSRVLLCLPIAFLGNYQVVVQKKNGLHERTALFGETIDSRCEPGALILHGSFLFCHLCCLSTRLSSVIFLEEGDGVHSAIWCSQFFSQWKRGIRCGTNSDSCPEGNFHQFLLLPGFSCHSQNTTILVCSLEGVVCQSSCGWMCRQMALYLM